MRRVTLMLAAVAMMVSLFAVVAYAAEIQGTENRDLLTESQRGDTIKGLIGDDDICAGPTPATAVPPLSCSAGYSLGQTPGGLGDRDRVHGNKGDDNIDLRDGDGKDIAWGGKGIDRCWIDGPEAGDAGDKFFGCEFINGNPV
jgi:hypothetical protein